MWTRVLLAVVASLIALGAARIGDKTAIHVAAGDIQAAADRAPKDAVSDQQIRMIDAGGTNVGVGVVSRPSVATSGGIVHDKLTEVYYVLEGAGMLVTGGAVVGGARLAATSPIVRDLAGPSAIFQRIEGGERRRIAPGDVVIIPAGVPHWFENVEGTIRYLVVRVDPEQAIALK